MRCALFRITEETIPGMIDVGMANLKFVWKRRMRFRAETQLVCWSGYPEIEIYRKRASIFSEIRTGMPMKQHNWTDVRPLVENYSK